MAAEHILLLGATGQSGVLLIKETRQRSNAPFLTLFIRPGSKGKLPSEAFNNERIRIVEGELTDTSALKKALSTTSNEAFPPVKTVVGFLGSYVSVAKMFTRDKSHPLADAFTSAILPTIKGSSVSRILVLSAPAGFHSPEEAKGMSLKWWFYCWLPVIFTPQGNSEMGAIARAVIDAGQKDSSLEWTVFRVPNLTDGDASLKVLAGTLDKPFNGSITLSRGSLVRWVLDEIEQRGWVRGFPLLANP